MFTLMYQIIQMKRLLHYKLPQDCIKGHGTGGTSQSLSSYLVWLVFVKVFISMIPIELKTGQVIVQPV